MPDADLEIKVWGRSPKILFLSSGPQFGVKKYVGGGGGEGRATRAPSLDPPL